MMIQGILDRFEDHLAVIETDNHVITVARADLPENASVGDVLNIIDDTISIDHEATKTRRLYMEKLVDSLWED